MSNTLKITIARGKDAAEEIERDLFTSLLVGRSRSADIRLKDADVSGKHFEFVRNDRGCFVRELSRHGMELDGKGCGEGMLLPIRTGSVIGLGQSVRITVEALPDVVAPAFDGEAVSSLAADADAASDGTDFFDVEESVAQAVTKTAAPASGKAPPSDATITGAQAATAASFKVDSAAPGAIETEDGHTRGDFDEALTEAGEGETQEMKTRVGSIEEIVERKRQLDRASAKRRWHFGVAIGIVMLALAAAWFFMGTHRHVTDAEGPFLPNGELDIADWELKNDEGAVEIALEYPRDERMRVKVAATSNAVDVSTFLGVDRDVPFHLEFSRHDAKTDLAYSLEDSFERFIAAEASKGTAFERRIGARAKAEFFENTFRKFCEKQTQHGTRFMRIEYTRSRELELWHGVLVYFRRMDRIYTLWREVPDMYWKRAGYRVQNELHLAMCAPFLTRWWDSPGRGGLIGAKTGDNELLTRIRHDLSADRASSWHDAGRCIDTLLVRSWNTKPIVQQATLILYKTYLERLTHFYNERRLAFELALKNHDDKRARKAFRDCQAVFGDWWTDRRSTLVNDPEEWKCP